MTSRYIEWLKAQGVPLFQGGGLDWRLYHGALIPAPASPFFVELHHEEAISLLKRSGAKLLRFASEPQERETEWWYIVCDFYDPDRLSSNTRSKIRRGFRNCIVHPLDTEWIAEHGYQCYLKAFDRYTNARPITKIEFRDMIMNTIAGPFEYWGVFVQDVLAGYSQCIIEEDHVITSVFKYHPAFLKFYTSYALVVALMQNYVVKHCFSLSNGTRSVAHSRVERWRE